MGRGRLSVWVKSRGKDMVTVRVRFRVKVGVMLGLGDV